MPARFHGAERAQSRPPSPALSAAARTLLAHAVATSGLRSLPGAHWVTTGSQPSVRQSLSRPDLVAGDGVPKLFWTLEQSTMVVSQ